MKSLCTCLSQGGTSNVLPLSRAESSASKTCHTQEILGSPKNDEESGWWLEWNWLTLVMVTCPVCMAELLVMNPRAAVSQLEKQAEASAVWESCALISSFGFLLVFSPLIFFFFTTMLLYYKVFAGCPRSVLYTEWLSTETMDRCELGDFVCAMELT